MHRELAFIREKPGLSLGGHNESFTALCGFITGYEVGYGAGTHSYEGSLLPDVHLRVRASLVPLDFHRFVTEYYGEEYPAGGRGWEWFVREHASSDQDAFRLFFGLLDEYDRQHPSA